MATSPAEAHDPLRQVQVAVLAKAPIPGLAKTRLVPTLGLQGAARLQRQLTRQALQTAQDAGLGTVTLWCAPDARHRFFRALQRATGVPCRVQPCGDLGDRMHTAFRVHCTQGPLLLIGTDCPVLQPAHLRQAAMALIDGIDAVFQPAEDGGYVLVGLRQPQPALFHGMTWSTDQVMVHTRARARAAGLRVLELDTLWDVDLPEDLARWRGHTVGASGGWRNDCAQGSTPAARRGAGIGPQSATSHHPPGQAMLKFYYSLAPNPMKVALFLEEAGLPYQAIPVDTRKGEQHAPAFMALNPNAKVPVIVDGASTVFDSNAILLYLAEKTGQFLPAPQDRGPMLSWLMFVASGIGPFTGQCVHFKHYAPEPNPYALNRYDFEAWRHWKILDAHLANRPWMLGDRYTLLDMAVWGWARAVPFALGAEAWAQLPHVKRLLDAVNERPAAQRAAALKDRHAFKTDLDDEARRAMFPQNERLKV